MTGIGLQSFAAVLIVLGLVAALAWLARRGSLGALKRKGRYIDVETAVPLGERRSLVVGSSRVDLQACKLEYSIVSPK